jgi:NADH dehydrogenase
MASAISVLVKTTFQRNFRRIDLHSVRIILVDMGQRPLDSFDPSLSDAAKPRLERLGVEVRLGRGVDSIDGGGVIVAGERIRSHTVIWTAGVAPSPAGKGSRQKLTELAA